MAHQTEEERPSPEAVQEAQARLEKMNLEHSAVQAAQPGPVAADANQEQKRTRTTVAKLAQRYQERINEMAIQIKDTKMDVALATEKLKSLKFQQAVWQEALDEINRD